MRISQFFCLFFPNQFSQFWIASLISITGESLEWTFVTSQHPSHSPLPNLASKQLLFIGQRSRFSTCTAVAWAPDAKYLVSANLIANTLHTFSFDGKKMLPLQFLSSSKGIELAKPEHLCFSPEGDLLAVANGGQAKVNFYLASNEGRLNPIPIAVLKEPEGTKFHSVRFSPDGEFFACATFDNGAKISIFRLIRLEKGLSFIPTQIVLNRFDRLKPKGIAFSPDQRFVAICYSKRAGRSPNENFQSLVEVYAFDSLTGTFNPAPLSQTEANLCVPEDLLFDPIGPYLFVSNQGNDTITVHEFDPKSGILKDALHACLKNPKAQLSFPHGISMSSDGAYLASSNYGDDKITVYKIRR